MAGGRKARLENISFGILLFRFGTSRASTWVRLRPRVQADSWLHISAVIKLATRQNRLQLYTRPCISGPHLLFVSHFRNITCSHMLELKGTWSGKHYIQFRLRSVMKASYRVRWGLFLISSPRPTRTITHMKSCTNINSNTFFKSPFLPFRQNLQKHNAVFKFSHKKCFNVNNHHCYQE